MGKIHWRDRFQLWVHEKKYRLCIARGAWYMWALPWFILSMIGLGLIWISFFMTQGKEAADDAIKGF
jgi:hypothetical protein